MRLLGQLNLLPGTSLNNMEGSAARLSLADLAAGNAKGILVASEVGVDGNDLTFELLGDSPPAGGVTVDVLPSGYLVHYESGVSTDAQVRAAVNALVDPDDFAQFTAGPYPPPTVLTSPGDDIPETNLEGGGDAFAIPYTGRGLELISDKDDVHYKTQPSTASWDQLNPAAYVPPFDTPSDLTADASDYELVASFYKAQPIGPYGCPTVLAAYNNGSDPATVLVYLQDA